MAEETITILKVGTEEAVSNINDLKNNIKQLKDDLGKLAIGTEEYQDTLDELKVNQNALKDAMYATTASMEDVAKSATGASESYNSLVHRMAALKEEFRATNDAAKRLELGAKIKEVNDQLKQMDALQGNFQRNVGNYTESIKKAFSDMAKSAADKTDALGKGLKAASGGLNGVKDGFEGIAKSPAVATIGILVSLAMKLADNLKDNEQVMESIKKAMKALEPVMQFFQGVLDTIIDYVVELIGKVGEWLGSSGFFSKLVDGLVGVGNAILKFVIAPFKGIVAAVKVFQEDGIKAIGKAAKAFGQEMKSGVAFKSNFEAGQAAAETMAAGMESRRKKVTDTAGSIAKDAAKTALADWEKALSEGQRKLDAIRKQKEDIDKIVGEVGESLDEITNQEMDGILAEIDATIQAEADLFKKSNETALQAVQYRKQLLGVAVSSTSDILGSLADIYESDEKNSEKNAAKVKGLRIASATIDTISGAISAYMNAQKQGLPPYISIPMGIASAATVTAAGLANIAKLKSVNPGSSTSASTNVTPAVASAPSLAPQVANVRSITSASEEQRLNQMASDQRVYILASDIEASQNQIKTQVSESSF